jgi:hypothetical protein
LPTALLAAGDGRSKSSRNPNANERDIAARKAAAYKTRHAPGTPPQPPELPATAAEWAVLRRRPRAGASGPTAPVKPKALALAAAPPHVNQRVNTDFGCRINWATPVVVYERRVVLLLPQPRPFLLWRFIPELPRRGRLARQR